LFTACFRGSSILGKSMINTIWLAVSFKPSYNEPFFT
jgi:hypothetical protein